MCCDVWNVDQTAKHDVSCHLRLALKNSNSRATKFLKPERVTPCYAVLCDTI
jgi:hypothetical protein